MQSGMMDLFLLDAPCADATRSKRIHLSGLRRQSLKDARKDIWEFIFGVHRCFLYLGKRVNCKNAPQWIITRAG